MPLPPPLDIIETIVVAEQTVCDEGVAETVPVTIGLTNTVIVTGIPLQPLNAGVMVKVTVMGEAVVFVKLPLIVFPLPPDAMPVTETVLSLVQV